MAEQFIVLPVHVAALQRHGDYDGAVSAAVAQVEKDGVARVVVRFVADVRPSNVPRVDVIAAGVARG